MPCRMARTCWPQQGPSRADAVLNDQQPRLSSHPHAINRFFTQWNNKKLTGTLNENVGPCGHVQQGFSAVPMAAGSVTHPALHVNMGIRAKLDAPAHHKPDTAKNMIQVIERRMLHTQDGRMTNSIKEQHQRHGGKFLFSPRSASSVLSKKMQTIASAFKQY